jgi:coenzyme Q-binding protein COQ10
VGYKGFCETFTSLVYLDPPYSINVEYGGGPLKTLCTRWDFKPLEKERCEVLFFLSFELKSFLLGAMMDLFFDSAFRSMVSAFEKRAVQLYGER